MVDQINTNSFLFLFLLFLSSSLETTQMDPQKTAGKPIRCKAAICRKPGEALVIEEIEVAPPEALEVRIKLICASLCHSDLTFWKPSPGLPSLFPRIFGHEGVGVVESVGEGVEEVKQGDVVLPVFLPHCGECRNCKSSKSNMCSKFLIKFGNGMPRDGSSRFKDSNGEPIHHFLFVSSFSQYTVVDVFHVVRINPQMPLPAACLLSCGVTTGVYAAWKVAQVEEGSTVAIFGLGTVGLAVAEGARTQGASKIIGVDLNPHKFELGKRFGLTDYINPTYCVENRVAEVIREMTDGGADYCFECVGLASLMQDAFNSCREGGGMTVVLGAEAHGSPLSLDSRHILTGKTITGSLLGGCNPKSDIPVLAQKYLNKEVRLDEFVTHEVSLRDINKAFDLLLQAECLRCITWMDK